MLQFVIAILLVFGTQQDQTDIAVEADRTDETAI